MYKKAVTRTIDIQSNINEIKGIEKITRAKTWTLRMDGETTLNDIEDFYEVLESIFKECMQAHKKILHYDAEITQYVEFEDGSTEFDRWVSVPCNEQNGEGLYFQPDTSYTDASRDIYLQKKSLRKDFAYALRY